MLYQLVIDPGATQEKCMPRRLVSIYILYRVADQQHVETISANARQTFEGHLYKFCAARSKASHIGHPILQARGRHCRSSWRLGSTSPMAPCSPRFCECTSWHQIVVQGFVEQQWQPSGPRLVETCRGVAGRPTKKGNANKHNGFAKVMHYWWAGFGNLAATRFR